MPITADFPNGTVLDGLTWNQFIGELLEYEYCRDCGGDVEHHEPWIVMGHWFAHCKTPIAASAIVLTQHGGQEHTGLVLDRPHPLEGWVWVDWEHIGEHDETVEDVTVVGWGFR